ncbi:hypothetical protein H9L14_00460 [Sphingomonas sediminicola]|uniref:Uncharacterized protein n=1 Tax=Sphingomonas sediminicola TaxID=386874 RepID=A0ABX6TA62_9SPHN|nr:hypothetical protein [Sphingomonas sediminicola]QNP45837.1 hypothetical protein H9L14_00460 [Sphingomonas sediminicola]
MSAPLLAQAAPLPAAETAPAKAPFVKADAEAAVRDLANAVEENYLFPEYGRKYAIFLRANLAAGKYSDFGDAETFARKVTDDLREFHKDGHLRLEVARPEERGTAQAPNGDPRTSTTLRRPAGWPRRCLHRLQRLPGQRDDIGGGPQVPG